MGIVIFNMIMMNNTNDNVDMLETLSTGTEKRGDAYQEYVERRQIWETSGSISLRTLRKGVEFVEFLIQLESTI